MESALKLKRVNFVNLPWKISFLLGSGLGNDHFIQVGVLRFALVSQNTIQVVNWQLVTTHKTFRISKIQKRLSIRLQPSITRHLV